MRLTRRQFGHVTLGALGAAMMARPGASLAANPTGEVLHGLSVFGELQYGPGFDAFAYAVPDAPKGGRMHFSVPNWAFNQNPQTYDTLNTFILKGAAPPRIELTFDALMAAAADEPSALYGALAESVTISADRNSYTLVLREGPRFRSGKPVTAEDVAATYERLKADGHPSVSLPLQRLASARAGDERMVTLTFDGQQSDAVVLALLVLPILSKAEVEADSFIETTLTPLDGSGPYRVGRFDVGRYVEYERDPEWWGWQTPYGRGLNNFDVVRIDFFRDRTAAFEAFKKGEIEYREEFTSKTWATEYDFPALADGRVVKATFPPEKNPSIQGYVVNTRRPALSDPRTRQALGLLFDFEWTNENLFYGLYARNASYFQKSDFMASGAPSDAELALLEPLRDGLDENVFGEAITPYATDGSGRDRTARRMAARLLRDAGWERRDNRFVDGSGNPLKVEILMRSPTFQRILEPWSNAMRQLGVEASVRLVDPAQYQKRLDTFDFDITTQALSYGPTPSKELLEQIFGSRGAATPGSRNIAGISDPAIDALIEAVGEAKSREDLVTALKALDRVLRATHAWIPNWHSPEHRVAYWDKFGIPPQKPDYAFPVETTWWQDDDKAAAVGRG